MKQLTKEQSEAIVEWLFENKHFQYRLLIEKFMIEFPPACCDDCAEGHACQSEVKEILSRNESEFDSKEMAIYNKLSNAMDKLREGISNVKPIADVIGTKK